MHTTGHATAIFAALACAARLVAAPIPATAPAPSSRPHVFEIGSSAERTRAPAAAFDALQVRRAQAYFHPTHKPKTDPTGDISWEAGDPVLSCHRVGKNRNHQVACVDKTTGGGATSERLKECKSWPSEAGGGWQPSSTVCPVAVSPQKGWDYLSDAINSIADSWKQVVQSFGSTYSQQMIGLPQLGNGWKHFKVSAMPGVVNGVAYQDLPKFFKNMKRMVNMPTAWFKKFTADTKYVTSSEDYVWNQHQTHFADRKGSDCMVLMFFHNHKQDRKVDVVYIMLKQKFKLARDYLVFSQSRSTFGGFFSKTKVNIKKIPTGLKRKDLEFVADYFSLLAYQLIGSIRSPLLHVRQPLDPQLHTGH